jgi:Flp pilus assembly protein TadD
MDRSMKRKALLKMAAPSVIVATTIVGCSGNALNTHAARALDKTERNLATLAASSERALGKRDFAAAVTAAEAAVESAPDNAEYRTLLGRAYLSAGRYSSAELALADAMTLGAKDARTIVNLSLAKVAIGRSDAARALLADHMDVIPAPDYGLAMAMAGDPEEAVRILTQAVQEPGAGAKERQNLAYAYALSGRWRDARMMAEADLSSLEAMQRIARWAQTAERGAEAVRVAALVGGAAPAASDPGLPQRLALAQDAPMALAAAAPVAPEPVAAPEATPEPEAAPVAVASVEPAAQPAAAEAPLIRAQRSPARWAIAAAKPGFSSPLASTARPRAAAFRRVALIKPVPNAASGWVVQIGAYDSQAIAQEKWQRMARAGSPYAAFQPVNSTVTIDGRMFHRLAISGFAGREDAVRMCATIRQRGGSCFVRLGAPEAKPQGWAAAAVKGRQFAFR